MKKRNFIGLACIACAIIVTFFLGVGIGISNERKNSEKKLETSQKQCEELQKKLDKKSEEIRGVEDENITLMQRLEYYKDLAPISSNVIEFFKDGKKYNITTPQKIYKDFDCTEEVDKKIVITSTMVVELIMNEEQSTYALRTEGNKLVWCKEEPRIEEIK